MKDLALFRAVWHSSAADYDHTGHLTTFDCDMPWISGGSGEEWLCVDLGAVSDVACVRVCWGETYARAYEVLLSEDGVKWSHTLCSVGAADSCTETPVDRRGRYVKLLLRDCSAENYIIRSVSVMGSGGAEYTLPAMPEPEEDGSRLLSGGNWKLTRAASVEEAGEYLSMPGYDDSRWLPATVPGTALVSYLNVGAIPDPNYDDWQFQISDAYFTADFWYRNRFEIPAEREGQRVFLNFDAINWKADVFFNGRKLENALPERQHSIEGAFMRAKFDVTELAKFGQENHLAVRILKNDTPGAVTTQGLAFGPGNNGGLLGADNPTLHASVGWDWLPTIRGRNIGIYGDVRLSYGGAAELLDPWMETQLELLEERSAIGAQDLMLLEDVHQVSGRKIADGWQGGEGEGITVDFGVARTLGSVTLLWGREEGGAAADASSRHPEQYRLERSLDGRTWVNFDAYPGGEEDAPWLGPQQAEAHNGSDAFEGHAGSDSPQGATAFVNVEMPWLGPGLHELPLFAPQKARYLRFTVLKRRELNGQPVDTRLQALRVYAESPQQVEQARKHSYMLDTSKAQLTFRSEVRNYEPEPVDVTLRGRILPDGPAITCEFTLEGKETAPLELPLTLQQPRLWWPNTYGEQNLYTAEFELSVDGKRSDFKRFNFGVRRFDYPIDGGMLSLYCNGVRVLAKGGNWGMDDGLKRDTARVLDDKVRLHAEANMTMIRNWVGMTGHPGFYEACDKYGILIWDDFWLANPVDGPEPGDPALFLENAADKIRAVRSHASLAIYCGRNEGDPNAVINAGLVELTGALDGSRIYFPNSASLPVGSGGGYALAVPGGKKGIKQYFDDVSSAVLRSERGIPNVPDLESLKRFLKPEHLWPINEVWAIHDWTYHMNGPANSYMLALQRYLGGKIAVPEDRVKGSEPKDDDPVYQDYRADIVKMCADAGKSWSFEDFCRAAQLINYDNHRGLFDALASRKTNGLLMWMSQSSWPSFMWQTYDYYLDTNGGYFGAKAGNQPTRAIFDPRDDSIVLANASPREYRNAQVLAEVFDYSGKPVSARSYTVPHLEADAAGVKLTRVDFALSESDIVFLRLTLTDRDGQVLGRNTYWHNRRKYQDYRALNFMAKASVDLFVLGAEDTGRGTVRCMLMLHCGDVPALGLRLRLKGDDGSPVLPVFYSDNYLTMMPDEYCEITAEFDPARLKGTATWELSGWNIGK